MMIVENFAFQLTPFQWSRRSQRNRHVYLVASELALSLLLSRLEALGYKWSSGRLPSCRLTRSNIHTPTAIFINNYGVLTYSNESSQLRGQNPPFTFKESEWLPFLTFGLGIALTRPTIPRPLS